MLISKIYFYSTITTLRGKYKQLYTLRHSCAIIPKSCQPVWQVSLPDSSATTDHIHQYLLGVLSLSKSIRVTFSQVGCRCPGVGGSKQTAGKPAPAPAEECCGSGGQAAAVLSAKMAAHSPYRHRA